MKNSGWSEHPTPHAAIVSVTKSWTCPTCNSVVSTPYCPACGESPASAHDLTLRGLFAQLFRAVSNIDSRLMRSFRCLVTRPGLLTVAYVQGRRKPYIGPVQLFLIANVLFFAMPSRTNTPIVSSALDSHLHNQDWHAVARMDNILSLINLTACAMYLYIATGTVYGASSAMRVIKVLALALAVAAILLGYRFLLFLITLYTT